MDGWVFASWLLLSLSAPDEGPPPAGAGGSNAKDGATDLGLPARFFPIESRTDFVGYAGNYVPGATLTASGALRLAGGRDVDTAAFVDGFWMRRLAPPLGMFANAEVITAGYGAEHSDVAGGLLRFDTRAGSDRFAMDVDAFYQTAQPDHLWAAAPTVSGPIVPGRLFFALGGVFETITGQALRDPEGFFANAPGAKIGAGAATLALTWRLSPTQVIDSLSVLSDGGSRFGDVLGTDRESGSSVHSSDVFTGLRWRGRLTSAITARLQTSYQHGHTELRPLTCDTDPLGCDVTPSVINTYPRMMRTGNAQAHDHLRDRDLELAGALEARLPTLRGVEERLRFTTRWRETELDTQLLTPGDTTYVFAGTDRQSRTTFYRNDPSLAPPLGGWFRSGGSILSGVHSVEDELQVGGRLWMVPGVALVTSSVRSDRADANDSVVTPHLRLALDVLGNRRLWLHASASRRALQEAETLVGFLAATRASQKCLWNTVSMDYDRDCVRSGGNGSVSLASPCGPSGVYPDGTRCAASVALLPVGWETTAGLSGLLPGAVAAALTFVYRRAAGVPQLAETNQIWNASGTDVLGYRDGRTHQVVDWSAGAAQASPYLGVTASLEKGTGPFHFFLAYTFNGVPRSRIPGPTSGDDPDYSVSAVRGLARYDLAGYLSGALALAWDSSRVALSLPPGTNPYALVPHLSGTPSVAAAPPVFRDRSASGYHVNVQLRAHLKKLVRIDADIYGDVLNLVHSSAAALVSGVIYDLTQADPTVWRLGAQVWY